MDNPADFEARMRSLILNSGLPNQSLATNDVEHQDGSLPPVTSPSTGKRLTQAQRRQGMSNRMDLAEHAPRRGYQSQGSIEHAPRSVQMSTLAMTGDTAQQQTRQQQAASATQSWRNFAASNAEFEIHRHGHQTSSGAVQSFRSSGGLASRAQQHPQQHSNYPPPHRNSLGAGRPSSSHQSDHFYGRASTSGRSLYEPGTGPQTDMRPPFRQADYLDKIARVQIEKASMPQAAIMTNEYVRRNLEFLCKDVFDSLPETQDIPLNSVALECFGSIASGFATADSDMDIMLLYDSHPGQADKHKGIPRALEAVLLNSGFGARLLTRTRVPIIRFCERPPPELLQKLREARAQWDQEMAKLAAEGKSANDDVSEGDDGQRGTRDGLTPETQGSGEEGVENSPKKPSERARARKKGEEEKKEEVRPPPYNNDEERISLYRLAIKEDWFSPDERKIILQYAEAYQKAGGDLDNAAFQSARNALDTLPDVLSRFREPKQRKQELEYPKEGVGVQCDINFAIGEHSNPLAIHNTRLLRCYSMFDARIRQMVIFVKAWAKIRKINKPYHGTLSSYGYVLMVLHFVVNVADPPLAPNLQQVHIRNAQTNYTAPTTCNGYDIRFWQDPQAIDAAAHREYGQNQQSLGSLLAQFFRYYAVGSYKGVQGFQWMKDVLSLRTPGGLVTKQSKGWTGATEQAKDGEDGKEGAVKITHRYLLAIEDPFEHTHNVARPVMHHGIIAIRDEFRRANQLIVSQGIWENRPEDFFTEGVEKERAHRYFGPNPKHQKPRRTDPASPNNQNAANNTQGQNPIEKQAQSDVRPARKPSTSAAGGVAKGNASQIQVPTTSESKVEAFPVLSESNPPKTQNRQPTIRTKPPKTPQSTEVKSNQVTVTKQMATQPGFQKTEKNVGLATASSGVKGSSSRTLTDGREVCADGVDNGQSRPRPKTRYRRGKPKASSAGPSTVPS